MIFYSLKKTFSLQTHLLCNRNVSKVKIQHLFNFKSLHQITNQEIVIPAVIEDDKFPFKNSSKTTNIDCPHYLSCIHKPLTINLHKTNSANGDRKYLSKYPSVTTVLSNTKPASEFFGLMQWRKTNIEKHGKEKFGVMQRMTATKGTNFHQEMKTYFSNLNNTSVNNIDKSGFFQSVNNILPNITNSLAIESTVVHSQLCYAGTVDIVAEYEGKLSIIDWKTSQKKRTKLADCYSYPLQLAAYAGAINFDEDYPFQISNGVLVVAYENGDPADVHVLDDEILEEYWDKWLLRLNEFKARDIKSYPNNDPSDMNTHGPFMNTLDQEPNLDGPSETNEYSTKENFYESNQGPYSGVSFAPIVNGTKGHILTNGLHGVSLSSVHNYGTKLNEIGKTVKDEEIIASWRSFPGLMESVLGKGFVSKGLLFPHYVKASFKEIFKIVLNQGHRTTTK